MTSRANSMHSSNILSDALNEEREKQRSHHKGSHSESLRNTSSWTTTITVTNCFKVLLYITLYLLTACYFILWIVACNDTKNRCFKNKWKIFGKKYDIPHRLIYTIIGTILHLFIIIICLTFLTKYLIYSREHQIQEKIKKAVRKNEKTLHKFQKQPNTDMYEFFLRYYKKDKEKEDLFKLSAKHNNNFPNKRLSTANEEADSCCYSLLTHMKISWIIFCELFLSLFYVEYNEFNIMAMAALCYYIFSGILYCNINNAVQRDDISCNGNTYNVIRSDQIFFAAACMTKAFAIILPGVCINICQKWKCVYDEYYSPPEMSVTFKGDKFEHDSSESLNHNVIDRSAKPFMELRSVLNDAFIRCWIFMLFAVEVVMFVLQPIANHTDYRDVLNDQYSCTCVDVECNEPMQCKEESISFFIVNELILRLFVPMTLISTLVLVLSFEKKFFISRLDAIRYVISPSSISAILVLTLCELYWWEKRKNGIVTIWSVVYGITAVVQLYIFVALLDIQDNAYRNRDRLYGFKKSQPLTYYLEGVLAIGIIIICLTSFILEDNLDGHIDKTYIIVRGAGMLLFDLIELIMLIPMRTIAISPKFKKHFQKKGKKKYLRTFRWICFLNICNITYSTIFICDEFNNVLMDYNLLSTSTMRSAFTFSFGSIYFSIWGLSQLLPWIIPSQFESSTLYTYNPGIEQHSEISYMTQYHQVDKSRLGVGINSSCISPPPSNLMSDLDSSLKYKLNKRHCSQEKEKGDLSSLKIIESPPNAKNINIKNKSKKRPMLKERKINISFDENEDGESNCYGIEKYEDVIKMFQTDDNNNNQNDNVNQ